MMKRSRILVSLVLCFSLCISAVASAFADGKPHEEWTGTLRLLGPGIFSAVGYDGVVDPVTGIQKPGWSVVEARLQEEFPNVKFEIEPIPWDSYQAKIQTAVAGEMVDVIIHGAAVLDVVTDLTPYLEKDAWLKDELFIGAALRHQKEDNFDALTPTGIPMTISPAMMILDKQLFEDFGVELPDPSTLTWRGLADLAAKLTGINPRTGKQCYGVYPFTVSDGDIFKAYMDASWGVGAVNIDYAAQKYETQFNFTGEKSIEALTILRDLFQSAPRAFLEGLGTENVATEDNDIAIYMNEGNNEITLYNMMEVRGIEDRFVFCPLPIADNGASYTSHSGDNNIAIAKNSPNKDLGWEVIKFIVTDDAIQQWFVDTLSIPNNKAGFEKMLDTNKGYVKPIQEIYRIYPQNFEAFSSEFWNNGFGPANSVGSMNLSEMYAGNITPEQCAENLQAALEEYNMLNR